MPHREGHRTVAPPAAVGGALRCRPAGARAPRKEPTPPRVLLALLCGLGLVLPAPPRVVAAPSNDWPSPPVEQGLDSANLANALLTMPHEVPDLHRGLLLRDGKIVAAAVSPYDDTTPHDLGSVTKSGLTTLIGSAIDQGPLRRDDPVLAVFPDRTIANLDERRARMTVADLARMTSGFGSLQPTR